jgi:cysteine synthase A
MIHPTVLGTVGRTPLVLLKGTSIAVKLESRNPGGSVKDRIAVAMIEAAERDGRLKTGGTLIEATSGNTGIGLAMVAAAKGYRLVLTMPERMSKERIALLRYLGAEVVLTPGAMMREAVDRAKELLATTAGAVMLDQFSNPANAEMHRRTTAVEIWEDTRGEVETFVAGVGTGGTLTGVGSELKKRKPSVRVVAVEPERSAVLSGRPAGPHLIQGIGAGFVPALLDRAVIDEIITVSDEDAFEQSRQLAKQFGVSAGISSGAALFAAKKVAKGLTVVMLPDSGERYLSTPLVDALMPR